MGFIQAATDALTQQHGRPNRPNVGSAAKESGLHTHTQHSVLDSLVGCHKTHTCCTLYIFGLVLTSWHAACKVRTILSQNTTDVNSIRAFSSLKEAFPTWQSVLDAPNGVPLGRKAWGISSAGRHVCPIWDSAVLLPSR